MRLFDKLFKDHDNNTAAIVKPSTSPIQNPVAAIGTAGDQGNHAGARPSTYPTGIAKPQNASNWICMGWRVTLYPRIALDVATWVASDNWNSAANSSKCAHSSCTAGSEV